MGTSCTSEQFEDPKELCYQELTKLITPTPRPSSVQPRFKSLSEIKADQDFIRLLRTPSAPMCSPISNNISWLGQSLPMETISE